MRQSVLSQVFPELGAQVNSWIDQTVAFAQAYPAMPPCFSHGDFTYTQLIFDGKEGGWSILIPCARQNRHRIWVIIWHIKAKYYQGSGSEFPLRSGSDRALMRPFPGYIYRRFQSAGSRMKHT